MATNACDAQQAGMGALSQSFLFHRGQVVLPAHSCALSIWAGEAVVCLLALPCSSPSSVTAALHSWLGLVLWAGCSEGVSGLLFRTWSAQ